MTEKSDPHVVADLTADTFVAVIGSFGAFDPRKGTMRSWMFGIARRVYASHCEAQSHQQHKMRRLAGRRDLAPDQVEELLERIDAEPAGRGPDRRPGRGNGMRCPSAWPPVSSWPAAGPRPTR